jgi:hypothetical protein
MKVVTTFPPNYREINDAFNVRGQPVIFCYGGRIYNPLRVQVGPDLIAHESVHSHRQLAFAGGPVAWWQLYIADPAFRLEEELPAHQAEYRYWVGRPGMDRPVRGYRSELAFRQLSIARRLASPLYGAMISLAEALRLVAA